MATPNKNKSKQTEKKVTVLQPMIFSKQNYILLLASLGVIILGFIIMGSGNDKPFDHPMKITVAPIIVLLGFALGVFSIMYSNKTENNQEEGK
jgi:ABC-type antimicrobial peptide transport system permease subunit